MRSCVLLTDGTEKSVPVIKQFKATKLPFTKVEAFACERSADFQAIVKSLQSRKDTAIAIFNLTFKDQNQEEAIAWFIKNSKLPEMTFHANTVEGGLLITSAVSAIYHGREAVEMALQILNGKKASAIPVSIPKKGDVGATEPEPSCSMSRYRLQFLMRRRFMRK